MKRENYLITNCGFKDINPKTCGKEHCDPLHSFGPASREYYLLHYVVSGKGVLSVEDSSYKVGAGECFFIRPFEISTYTADEEEPWHYIWIGFECNIDIPELREPRVISSEAIGKIFRMVPDMNHISNGREAFLCSRIWDIITAIKTEKSGHTQNSLNYIQTAISYMETEYMMDISIAALAEKMNLNRSYFSTIFKEQVGISPQKYLSNFRLSKAANLITEYGYTATQAALSTGYADVFTFSKMFKRKYGVSPSAYKKKS